MCWMHGIQAELDDGEGWTALIYAVAHSSLSIVLRFREDKANGDRMMNFGNGSFQDARDRGDEGLPCGDDGDRLPVSMFPSIPCRFAHKHSRVRHFIQTMTAKLTPTSETRMIFTMMAPIGGLGCVVVASTTKCRLHRH